MTPRNGGPERPPVAVAAKSNQGDNTPAGPRVEDPDAEFRRRLTDYEVRALGYSHRDETGRWVHRRELESAARAALLCLTCGGRVIHALWCWRDKVDWTDEQRADREQDELAKVATWQTPPVELPDLSWLERYRVAS